MTSIKQKVTVFKKDIYKTYTPYLLKGMLTVFELDSIANKAVIDGFRKGIFK